MIVIIGSQKGGTGKSTTTGNLAVGLIIERKASVCVVGADRQRSISKWNEIRENNNIEPKIMLVEKYDNISQALLTLNEKFDYVIVDVAGRNSREFITGATVADIIIAPHQCSQNDLDTIEELDLQIKQIRDLNPKLKIFCYQTMGTTNPMLQKNERDDFLGFMSDFKDIPVLASVSKFRKVYRDASSEGKSVVECDNEKAKQEVISLIKEVF